MTEQEEFEFRLRLESERAPKPAAPPNSVGRQVGLFGRAAGKAVASIPSMLTDATTGIANTFLDAVGDTRTPRFGQSMPALENLMTRAGIPAPATPQERIVSQGVELGGAAATGAGFANMLSRGATPMFKAGLERLGANADAQLVGGAAAGMAGQQSKEAGDGWLGQLVSSVVGGILGGGAYMGAKGLADAAKGAFTPRVTDEVIEQKITFALRDQGIDPGSITQAMRSSIEEQVRQALKQGPVEGKAIGRLADYTLVNATPTRGRLSLDPYQITQEMNAAKKAAALGATDAQLPAIQSQNNKSLIGVLDDFGPVSDRFSIGQRATAPILGKDSSMESAAGALYQQARGMAGKDIPLERGPILGEVMRKLDAENLMPFADGRVMGMINQIMRDPNVPFDTGTLESLRRIVSGAYSPTANGNEKRALKVISEVIDNAQLAPDKRAFGGGQAVTGQMADRMQAADSMPQQLKDILDQARGAHSSRMRWQESAPGIQRTIEGANPDEFLKREILSRSVSADDVAKIAKEIKASPDALQAVRSGIIQNLKDSAIGAGNPSETGNFSGRGLQAAIDSIGVEKLKQFFNADEIDKIRAAARVGTIETFQPRGSAVNNSNTAAGIAGLLDSILGAVGPKIKSIPFGEAAITTPMRNFVLGSMERGALNQPRGLLSPYVAPDGSIIDPLAMPAIALGGGLLAPQ